VLAIFLYISKVTKDFMKNLEKKIRRKRRNAPLRAVKETVWRAPGR
jgi:hypothetical protein